MCQRPPAARTLPVQVARSSKAPGDPGLTAVGRTSQLRRSWDTAWPIRAWWWRRSGWPRSRGACRKKTCTSPPSAANQKSQIQCPASRRVSAGSRSPFLLPLDRPGGEAADEVALQRDEHRYRDEHAEDGAGGQQLPALVLLADQPGDGD